MRNEPVAICASTTVPRTEVRLRRIADAHHPAPDVDRGACGPCVECGQPWPCATYRWATDPGAGLLCDWHLDDCDFHTQAAGGRHAHPTDPRPI